MLEGTATTPDKVGTSGRGCLCQSAQVSMLTRRLFVQAGPGQHVESMVMVVEDTKLRVIQLEDIVDKAQGLIFLMSWCVVATN